MQRSVVPWWCIITIISSVGGGGGGVSALGPELLSEFYLEKDYTNLNHGSYGAVPRQVLSDVWQWQMRVERNPDTWFRYDVYDELTRTRLAVADYIGAVDANSVVLVDNASHGINAVLRSLLESRAFAGRTVLYLSTAYGMVKNTLSFTLSEFEFEAHEVQLTLPTNADEIVATVRRALSSVGANLGLCVFSHITSAPALTLPIARLSALCKQQQHDAMVLIDGAHAPGQIPLRVGTYNEDMYVGNFHKWMYAPKGTAFLWVSVPTMQSLIQPTVISWLGRGTTDFQKAFSYEGTNDYAPWMAIRSAIQWRRALCDSDDSDTCVFAYMHKLAVDGGRLLAKILGGWVLTMNNDDMIGAMVNVVLPSTIVSSASEANELVARLHEGVDDFKTWIPVFPVVVNSTATTVYVMRVSAQVYLDIRDFQRLGDAILKATSAAAPA